MIENQIVVNGVVREITVGSDFVKMITYTSENIDHKVVPDKIEMLINAPCCIIQQFANKEIVYCLDEANGEKVLFSINTCNRIVTVPSSAEISITAVCGELFVKITDEEKQMIYDEEGNLIYSSSTADIDVVFSGTEPVIERKDREKGRPIRITFELCSVC